MTSTPSPFQNAVFEPLSTGDLKLLQPSLQAAELPVRHVIETANQPIKTVYSLKTDSPLLSPPTKATAAVWSRIMLEWHAPQRC